MTTDRLLRHRWLSAAGMTATIAAIAGGGVLLARQDPAGSPPRDCGLVPCGATLPPAATPGGTRGATPAGKRPTGRPLARATPPAAARRLVPSAGARAPVPSARQAAGPAADAPWRAGQPERGARWRAHWPGLRGIWPVFRWIWGRHGTGWGTGPARRGRGWPGRAAGEHLADRPVPVGFLP